VHVASNGEEALDLLRKIKPDLMFLDVLMPKKHGFEVCQQVKKDPKLKDIYTILLTTKGQESDREIGLRLGADDYITKPFSPTKLIQKVREVLEGDTHG
ncbi:MAG: PleD family two-component system response regulator, partial [Candidatus Zixiibacteriota bacterium]